MTKDIVVKEVRNASLTTTTKKEDKVNEVLTIFKEGSRSGDVSTIVLDNYENKFNAKVEDAIVNEDQKNFDHSVSEYDKIHTIIGNQRVVDVAELKNVSGELQVANPITDKFEIFYMTREYLRKYTQNRLLFKIHPTPMVNVLDNSLYFDIHLPCSDLVGIITPPDNVVSELTNTYIGSYFINCRPLAISRDTLNSGRDYGNINPFDTFEEDDDEYNKIDHNLSSMLPIPKIDEVRYLRNNLYSLLYDDIVLIVITKNTIDVWEVYPHKFKEYANNILETFDTRIKLNHERDKRDQSEQVPTDILLTNDTPIILTEDEKKDLDKETGVSDMSLLEMLESFDKETSDELVKIKMDMYDNLVDMEKSMTIANPMVFYNLDLSIDTINLMMSYFENIDINSDNYYYEFFESFKVQLSELYDQYVFELNSIVHPAHEKNKVLKDRWKVLTPKIAYQMIYTNCFIYCNEYLDTVELQLKSRLVA